MEDLGIPSIKLSLPAHGIRKSLSHFFSEFSNIAPDPNFDRWEWTRSCNMKSLIKCNFPHFQTWTFGIDETLHTWQAEFSVCLSRICLQHFIVNFYWTVRWVPACNMVEEKLKRNFFCVLTLRTWNHINNRDWCIESAECHDWRILMSWTVRD